MGGSLWYGPPGQSRRFGRSDFVAADRSDGATNDNIYMVATVRPTGFTPLEG